MNNNNVPSLLYARNKYMPKVKMNEMKIIIVNTLMVEKKC